MDEYRFMKRFKAAFFHVQEFSLLCARTLRTLVTPPVYLRDTIYQMDYMGLGSLPVVLLTGFFTGAVLALQTGWTAAQFGAKYYLGRVVSISMVKELGPVLTALMLAGRVGAGITSEIGSMVVTDQVDALRAMGIDPVRKLVTPRMVALVFMAPILTILSCYIGLWGGSLIADIKFQIRPSYYWTSAAVILFTDDVIAGLTKPFVFGFLIAMIGCYHGLMTEGGSRGVGRATTTSVVVSSIAILIADYFVNEIFISIIEIVGRF